MFRLNGIPLSNPALGWEVLAASSVVSEMASDLYSIVVPGRDEATDIAARTTAPIRPIVVETPRSNQGKLRAVFRQRPLILTEDEQDGIEVRVTLLSISPETYGPADERVELTALLRIPGVFWRDVEATTSDPVAIDSAEVEAEVLAGLTGPVRDAIIRVHGSVTGLRVEDAGGTFFEYTDTLEADEYLRFEAATGKAYLTDTDTWDGGTEVTGAINNGPGPYYLEVVPIVTTPASPIGVLTVTSSARSGSPTVEVRGRRAHAV